jgi:hypothetical protein
VPFNKSTNWTLPVAALGNTVAVRVIVCPDVAGLMFTESAVDVVTRLTVCETAVDTLVASFVSPVYAAVILCAPVVKELVAKLAVPALIVPVPIRLPLSRNCTVPVAVLGETVAVNVTICPNVDGLLFEASTVVVLVNTVRVVEPFMKLKVAEIVAAPRAPPVASPWEPLVLLTEAIPELLELQVAEELRLLVLPSVYVPVAVNCSVPPTAIEGPAGVTAILDSTATPCPASSATCGLPTLSVKVRFADRAPAACGVNVTPTAQFVPTPNPAPQVLV